MRFALLLIAVVMVLIVGLAFYEPTDVTIERTIRISSQQSVVFDDIKNFNHWNKWNTFLDSDSSTKISFGGVSGLKQSSLVWQGDDSKTGSGIITCTDVSENTFSYSFSVTSPGKLEGDGTISVYDSSGQSFVTWQFHKHFPFLENASLIVFDFEKYFAPDMEKSLKKLKGLCEND